MTDEEDLYNNVGKNTFTDDTGTYPSMEYSPRFHKWTRKEKLVRFLKLSLIKRKCWRIRKRVGSAIIGNPEYGKGILINIPIGWMTDDQKKIWWEARRFMQLAGITCDSGMGCGGLLDLEFDWSLHGAVAKCKRCGYDSREHIKEYVARRVREHHENIKKEKTTASGYDCRKGTCNCLNDKRGELGF